jgi:hypothetical protein
MWQDVWRRSHRRHTFARARPSPTLFFFSLLFFPANKEPPPLAASPPPPKSATNSSDLTGQIVPHPFLKVIPFEFFPFIH